VQALAEIETNTAKFVADADGVVEDPHIAASLANLDASSAQLVIVSQEVAATGASVQAIAKDGEETVHDLVHPKPLAVIADWTLKVVGAVRNFFW
jgi:hypothetical protein